MTRNYGAIVAVLLTDVEDDASSVMRIPSEHVKEFLEPFHDDVVVPELDDFYNQIQLYLSTNRLTLLGPLSTARAAYAMKAHQLTPAQAVDVADQQAQTLLTQQAQRLAAVEKLLAADGRGANVFANSTTGQL